MDWKILLKGLQYDFIARMKSGNIFYCEKEGYHSELTVISGKKLQEIQKICWERAEKYQESSPVNHMVRENMNKKLGEEVLKARLTDLISKPKKVIKNNLMVDFALSYNQNLGINVKTGYGEIETIEWEVTKEEVEQNVVIVFVKTQEEVSVTQDEYNLILAGFMPTVMIEMYQEKTKLKLKQLLYGGGLRSYLENINQVKYDNISLAKECYEQEDYKATIAYCNEELNQGLENGAEAYYTRGLARYKMGDKQGAIEDYTEAIKLNKNLVLAYTNRGNCLYKIGKKQEAISDYTQAIKLNPNYPDAYYNRGVVYSDIGDKKNAIADYSKAVALNPNYTDAYYNRAVVKASMGDKQGAIADYTEAIRITPNLAKAYNHRGLARLEIGNKQGAIADYTEAIRINPKYVAAYYNRGVARKETGEQQGVIEDYNAVIKINPRDAKAYNNRGLARFEIGDKQGAIVDYDAAIEINPNYAKAYYNRGNAKAKMGDKQGAIADYIEAVRINPHLAPAYYNKSMARLDIGDKYGAISDLQKAAILYEKQGNIQWFQKAKEKISELEGEK